jgi:2-iminobutanoate/2-iminopropanoate deaminase
MRSIFQLTSSLVLLTTAIAQIGCAARSSPGAAGRAAHFASPDAGVRQLPFSESVRAGDLLFLSGQIGTIDLVPGGMEAEAKRTIENIRAILERRGASLADVVKCTVFLADMADWPAFNEIYRSYFQPPYPARSALGVNGLARGARVELECVAFVPGR